MNAPLANPFWSALTTRQAALALAHGGARRFAAGVIPFAAVESPDAGVDLAPLLDPGEQVYVIAERALTGVREIEAGEGVQMILPGALTPEAIPVDRLGPEDVPAMLALKAAAFPGYFGPRAPSLGTFFGIRCEGALLAMCGERLALPGLREISALCTLPGHTGKGYAEALLRRVVREQASRGEQSFLHADARNTRAIALYERLGFVHTRSLVLRLVERAL